MTKAPAAVTPGSAITFVICIKAEGALSPEVLKTQVWSCLSVPGSEVLLGLSAPFPVAEAVAREIVATPDGRRDVLCRVLHDSSLYDAWNRSIEHCSGRWISFLGFGDIVVNPSYYGEASRRTDVDAIFSRVIIHGPHRSRVFGGRFAATIHRFRQRAAFSGALIRKEFLVGCRFDPSFHVAGDYEFLLRCGHSLRSAYVPTVSVSMPSGGLSERATDRLRTELRRARSMNRGR